MNIYKKSFLVLLDEALDFKSKDQVLIIYDESFFPYLDSLIEVINKKGALSIFTFLPFRYQKVLVKQNILPYTLIGAIAESTIIINVLSNDSNTTPLRKAIVQQKRLEKCRLAHLPGVTKEILKLIEKSSFSKVKEECELLAWVLGEAKKGQIITYDSKGNEYFLHLNLGGWDNEPIMSPGILFHGTWGNALPGETFCCPNHTEVEGQICVNGSLPNLLLKPKSEVVLEFKRGKLSNWYAEDIEVRKYFEILKRRAKNGKDLNWNSFAELGFGLNPEIKKLTGNPLFDEKMASTIHIAIGDNSGFGYNIKSSIHVDMVIKDPTVIFNEKEIMSKGKLNEELIKKWKKNHEIIPLDLQGKMLYYNSAKALVDEKSRVLRKCSKPGRVCFISILDENEENPTSYIKLLEAFNKKTKVLFEHLISKIECNNKQELEDALHKLIHYKIVDYR